MSPRSIRAWSWVHKWSSLVCTAFMLLLCLTGLPLVFHHEIEHLLGNEVEAPAVSDPARRVPLEQVLATARARHPDRVVQYASQDEDKDDLWFVTLTPTPKPTQDFVQVVVDGRTGEVVPSPPVAQGFLWVMLRLHVDLFADLPGKLFMGGMGLLLVVAIVSGVVLYAPFMRKLAFGTVRQKAPRARWLDLHNLLGIVTVAWLLVVGVTGVLHTAADLLHEHWQQQVLSPLLASERHGADIVPETQRASAQRALDAAYAAAPGTRVSFIAFPGTAFSTPHHLTFYVAGNEPFSGKLRQAILVDARSAQVTAMPQRPWYLTVLQVAEPLHFGDYGGMPMKILWALLDVATIVVLGTGLYLWRRRGAPAPAAVASGALRERTS